MRKLLPLAPAVLLLTACSPPEPPPPPPPDTVVVMDTVTITREVPPPLPEGDAAVLCLASGQNVEIRVSAAGDTLIGPRRVRLRDLGPAVGFVGNYADDEAWFINDDPITLDRRRFSKFGQPQTMDCRDLKIIGEHQGVNLFAETVAGAPFSIIYVPESAGIFQPYQAQVGRVRG